MRQSIRLCCLVENSSKSRKKLNKRIGLLWLFQSQLLSIIIKFPDVLEAFQDVHLWIWIIFSCSCKKFGSTTSRDLASPCLNSTRHITQTVWNISKPFKDYSIFPPALKIDIPLPFVYSVRTIWCLQLRIISDKFIGWKLFRSQCDGL